MRNENSVCNFPRDSNLIADNVSCRIVCAVVLGTELDALMAGLRTTPVTFPYMNDLTSVSAATCSSNVIGISARIVLNASFQVIILQLNLH
jgi:hypothetical protein